MKNVVITGSTRGIGFSMAREFLKAGCNVTLSGRGEALLKKPKMSLDHLIRITSIFNATFRKKQACKSSGMFP